MNGFIAAVRHGILGLARFSGRDSLAQFWLYTAFVLAMLFVAAVSTVLPPITYAMDRAAAATLGGEESRMAFDVRGILYPVLALTVLAVVALAAAVVRRLHDRDRSGWWGTLPLPFLAVGFTLTPVVFDGLAETGQANVVAFFMLFFNNAAYLLSLLWLLVLLVCSGTRGANRFGPEPDQSRAGAI